MKKLFKLSIVILTLLLTISVITSCDIESIKDSILGGNPQDNAECEHSWSEATCDLPSTCEKCDATNGSALGHTEKTVPGYAATCTTSGLTDGKVCDACGYVILKQSVIPSLGHTPGAEATCTEDQVCTKCDKVLVEKHHTPGSEATCTEDQVCTKCDEVLVEKHHVPGAEATCTEDQVCTKCDDVLVEKHHTIKVTNGYAAGCTTDGLTDGEICDVCDEVLLAQEVIPSLGHTPGAEATCTTDQVCTRCNEVLVEKHHTPGAEATCTTDQKCTVCNVTLVAKHHTLVTIEGYAATCTKRGLTDGKKCSVCGTVTVSQKYINMVPHTEVEVPAVEPTCTESGLTAGVKCEVCNKEITKQTSVPATGHSFDGGCCTVCGQEYYTEGMVFELSYNGEYYIVARIGTTSDKDIVIPSEYKGLPVEIIGGDFTRYSNYKTNFETITIPSSIREIQTGSSGYISYGAFDGCVNLKKVYIESVESWFNVRVHYTSNREGCNPMNYGAELYAGGELVTEVAIPTSITELEYDYFYGCSSITKIIFHDSLYAMAGFANLPGLTEVNIPSSVKVIKGNALYNCQNLSVITIPDTTYHIFTSFSGTAYYNNPDNWDEGKVLYIGKHLIKVKTDISGEYTVKAGTKSISPYAFESCRNLTKLNLNSELLVIGNNAFSGNTSLKSLTIPYNVRYIGDNALSGIGSGNKFDLEIKFEYTGAWYQHGNLYSGLSSSGYIYGSRTSAYVALYLNNNRIAGTGYGNPRIDDYTCSEGICR